MGEGPEADVVAIRDELDHSLKMPWSPKLKYTAISTDEEITQTVLCPCPLSIPTLVGCLVLCLHSPYSKRWISLLAVQRQYFLFLLHVPTVHVC